MTAPAIRVDGLTKRYGGVAAVDGLSFDVHPGTVTAFLGPNGAGKTTTIRALLGLTRPDEGRALVFDRPFPQVQDPLREVGVLIDGAGMDPRRTASDHLAFVCAAAGLPSTRAAQVLETVELTGAARKKVGAFSLGMRQRLGLATALLGEPRLLVLDEPANGLDPAGTRWLRTFLRDYAAQGRTVFVSSHVLSEVALFADEVVVVDRGRLVQHTTVPALMADTVVRVRTPSVEELSAALSARGASIQQTDEDRISLTGMSIEQTGKVAAAHHIVLYELAVQQRALEDVFLELTSTQETS